MEDQTCARCGATLVPGQAELVMSSDGRGWGVCRPCSRGPIYTGDLRPDAVPIIDVGGEA